MVKRDTFEYLGALELEVGDGVPIRSIDTEIVDDGELVGADVGSIENELDSINSELIEVENQLDSLDNDTDILQGHIDNIREDVSELQDAVSTLEGDVSDLEDRGQAFVVDSVGDMPSEADSNDIVGIRD